MNPTVRFFKRLMDVGLSAACMLGTSPVMAAIAAAIKLTSRGRSSTGSSVRG